MAANQLAPAAASATAKVKKAVTSTGAKGAKGFLIWAAAALPAKLVKPIVAAAAKHVPATSPGIGRFGSFAFLGRAPVKFRRGKIGRLGRFGQTGLTGVGGTYNVGSGSTQIGITSGGYGTAPVGSTGTTSATIASTPSTAGSTSWASDIMGAITAAGAAASTVAAVQQQLNYAQQGAAPAPIVVAPSGAVTGTVMGMSPAVFWFMALGAGALLLVSEHHKKHGG